MTSNSREMTPIALCADDYAFSSGIDDGILALAEKGRITAFSCMTASPRWLQAAKRLRSTFGTMDVGLHLALTQVPPLGHMPKLAAGGRFPERDFLYGQAILRRLDLDEIEAEFTRQLDAFESATGREPDFLDGHHHVHQLPGIRDVVARLWHTRNAKGWVRNTATTPASLFARGIAVPRAAVIALFGYAAKRTWNRAGIATNSDFAGVRNFDEAQTFRELMRGYLKATRPGLLVMCHPGHPDTELARLDTVTNSRADELAYLAGEDFPIDLAAAGCRLVRLSSLAVR